MSGTALHAAITALAAGFTSIGIEGLSVTDGPAWDPQLICLEVGWSPVDPEAASIGRAPNNAAASMHQEAIAIDCLLSVHSGVQTVAEARGQLIDVFDQLEQWLTDNVHLDDSVDLAQVTSIGYYPVREEGGAMASMRFTVACTAFV